MIHRRRFSLASLACIGVIVCLVAIAVGASAQSGDFEATARGFPVMRDASGKKVADGDFAQWLENDRLHVRIRYQFGGARRVEETVVLRQTPRLVQEAWTLREGSGGKVIRDFSINFGSGMAVAKKVEDGAPKEWSDKVDVEPGRTFAGFGFTMAIKKARQRLLKGERVELQAIGFTPKPKVVTVEISHGGLDQMQMSGREIRGDRFVIHPKIPWLAELFVKVPDTMIWLTSPAPAGFLRFEGPLAEPSDPVIRVDLLPGGPSGPARPVGARGPAK